MNRLWRSTAAILILSVVACGYVAAASSRLLVPGKQAGKLRLGSYRSDLPIGAPDYSDAGMSHYVEMWISKDTAARQTLVTESVSNGALNGGPGVTLTYVRVTSPYFHDRHHISTGLPLSTIRRYYPHLAAVDVKSTILADDAEGIAFEFDTAPPTSRSKCIAISIYSHGAFVRFDAAQVREMVDEWHKSTVAKRYNRTISGFEHMYVKLVSSINMPTRSRLAD